MEQTSKKKTAKPYSSECRARAVGLAMEHRDDDQSEAAALTAIAGELGCAADILSCLDATGPARWRRAAGTCQR